MPSKPFLGVLEIIGCRLLHIVKQAAKWYFTPETILSIAFYSRVSIECSFMILKSQQMVLNADLQSEMVLTIFTILLGVIIFNSLSFLK